mmetsp:Transcript_103488/g.179694  ORF Transcript_103488/g.179694 Transcript_103488/m.179694 type:complete len:111 (+) Transcript_103488:894-1226(+)
MCNSELLTGAVQRPACSWGWVLQGPKLLETGSHDARPLHVQKKLSLLVLAKMSAAVDEFFFLAPRRVQWAQSRVNPFIAYALSCIVYYPCVSRHTWFQAYPRLRMKQCYS